MRGHGAQVLSRAPARCAGGVGTHGTRAATIECTVALALPADKPSHSAAPSTCTTPSMDSSTSRRRVRRHFSSVGNGCRCYPTFGTFGDFHSSYQPTLRKWDTLPCTLASPIPLVTACGPAVRLGSADGDGWRRHAHRVRRAGRPGLAASCSWPRRPIQSFFFEQKATRERPEERRTARSRFGGWFLHERGSRI